MSSAEQNITELLARGELYDALTVAKSIHARYTRRNDHAAAIRLCSEYAEAFAKAGSPSLAAELGLLMVQTFTDFNLGPTADRVERTASVIKLCDSAEQQSNLMQKAIKWSQTTEEPTGSAALHRLAAKSYQNAGQYGASQGHLVYFGDGAALAQLLGLWAKVCYPSEVGLLVLRLMLMLLCSGRQQVAKDCLEELQLQRICDFRPNEAQSQAQFLYSAVNDAALQLAYFIVAAAASQNHEFYEAVKKKYTMVIRRDATTFNKLFIKVEEEVFNRARASGGGLMNLLSSLMQPEEA